MNSQSKAVESSASKVLKCDGAHECTHDVTHIEEKGFVYCTEHGVRRRHIGRRCRKLRTWELSWLRAGKTLPSYEPISLELATHIMNGRYVDGSTAEPQPEVPDNFTCDPYCKYPSCGCSHERIATLLSSDGSAKR